MVNRICQICGLDFKGIGTKKHDSYCKIHLRACAKFDTIYNPEECEAIRNGIESVLPSNEISLHEKVDAAEKLFRANFSQSVRDFGFDLKHCSFTDYRGKLLGRKYFKDLLRKYPDVHSLLLKRWL